MVNLVELHPESAGIADSKGRYPLHLACLAGKSWTQGVSELFDAYPDAIRNPDSVGLLPFHIAAFRYSVVASTVQSPRKDVKDEIPRPSTVDAKSRRTSRSVAVEAEHAMMQKEKEDAKGIEVLFHLLKADPTVLY